MAGEIVRVPRDLVRQNPFAPQCTKESMMADLAKIGTVKQWTEKFGRMFGHDASITDNVARLLTEGVSQWNFKPTMEVINNIYPEATPATWWIFMYADNKADKQLYSKLAECAQDFHPFVWNEETTRAWAVAYLRAVHDEMTEEGVQEMMEHMRAYDALALGAGRIDG